MSQLPSLRKIIKAFNPIIKEENKLYSQSSVKGDLYQVEKTREMGEKILDNIITKWVYLDMNLNQQEYIWMRKAATRQIRRCAGCQYRTALRIIAKLHLGRMFEQLSAIQTEVQQLLCRVYNQKSKKTKSQINLAAFSLSDEGQEETQESHRFQPQPFRNQHYHPEQKIQQLQSNTRELLTSDKPQSQLEVSATVTYIRTIHDDSTVRLQDLQQQKETSNFSRNQISQLDYSSISAQSYSEHDKTTCFYQNLAPHKQIRCIPKQEQDMHPDHPVTIYLENDISSAAADLSEFVHQYRINHPTYTRILDNRRYKVLCRLEIPMCYESKFQDKIYLGEGSAHSSKIAKAQAAKKVLYKVFSKNERVWKEFIAKKRIKGLFT